MFRTFTGRAAVLAVATVLLISACSDDATELEGTVVKDGLGCSVLEVDRQTTAPEVAATDPVEELVKKDLKVAGKAACKTEAQPFLTLDMVGAKASDGSVFVNTFGADRPVTAQLGQGQLIAGLEVGLAEMGVGGRRRITVPAAEAYGAAGDAALGIGPDETLVFVVDLVAVSETAKFCNANTAIPPAPEGVAGGETKPTEPIEMPITPPTELKISTVRAAPEGAEVADGDKVKMHYLGIGCGTGAQFDTSWDSGEPFEATAGGTDTIDGFSKGLIGARVGELRRLDIPSEQAYGDDALVFLIEVVEILPAEETTTTAAAGDATTTTTATASTADATTTTTTAAGDASSTTAGDATTTTTEG